MKSPTNCYTSWGNRLASTSTILTWPAPKIILFVLPCEHKPFIIDYEIVNSLLQSSRGLDSTAVVRTSAPSSPAMASDPRYPPPCKKSSTLPRWGIFIRQFLFIINSLTRCPQHCTHHLQYPFQLFFRLPIRLLSIFFGHVTTAHL